jgi:hypothetical protein
MIKSLKDLLDKLSRFTNSLVYDGGICKRLYNIINCDVDKESHETAKNLFYNIISNFI